MITSPITRPITSRIASAIAGARVGGANPLVWHAAYPDADGVMQAQLIGSGTPTFNVDAGLLMQTSDGGYIAVAEDTPPWHGARWVDGVAYGTDGSGDPLDPLPSLYGAPAYTNSLTYSNDLTNAAWNVSGTPIRTLDAVGITGAPNTATTLTDDDGAVLEYVYKNTSVSADTATHTVRVFVLKDTNEARFPEIQVQKTGGTLKQLAFQFNTKTGAYNTARAETLTNYVVEINSVGIWWEILIQGDNDGTGNAWVSLAFPAMTTTLGASEVTATGSIIVGNIELHLNKTIAQVRGSAPIITAASTVTTSAISMSYDIANHSDDKGAYYCEFTPLFSWDERASGNEKLLTLNPGTVYGPISCANSGNVNGNFSVWDSAYSGSVVNSNWTGGTAYKVGSAYSTSESKLVTGVDGTFDATPVTNFTGHFPTYPTAYTAISVSTTSQTGVKLIRNIRRYNLSYTAAVAKLEELTS